MAFKRVIDTDKFEYVKVEAINFNVDRQHLVLKHFIKKVSDPDYIFLRATTTMNIEDSPTEFSIVEMDKVGSNVIAQSYKWLRNNVDHFSIYLDV